MQYTKLLLCQFQIIFQQEIRLKNKITDPDLNDPSLNESDIDQGLINLVQKGKIPRGAPLGKALLGKNAQFFQQKPMRLQNGYNKFDPQIIKESHNEFTNYNAKLDSGIKNTHFPQLNIKQHKNFDSNFKKMRNNNSGLLKINNNNDMLQIEPFNSKFMKSSQLRSNNNESNKFNQSQQSQNSFQLSKAQAKNYPQVMDQYSLHHFIIRKGKILDDTPEFQSYERCYKQDWNSIILILEDLENLMQDFEIPTATVDGKQVADLASQHREPSIEDLVQCLVNQKEILKIIKVPSLMFKGPEGEELAAGKIQSTWKMYLAVAIIQQFFLLQKYKKDTKGRIRNKNEQVLDQFQTLQEKLKSDWLMMKYQKRVEIHINTYSFDELKRLTMEKVTQRQNIQITRIFALKDPLLELIYISPYDLPQEIINYYYKILELNGLEDFRNRLHFIWPENHQEFPTHTSTSKLLHYSPKAMKRIRNLVNGKYAYMVPGYPSNDDVKLATELNIPLYSGKPQQVLSLSTKSGAKRIFQAAQVPTAPGASEIYDEKEFFNTLAILIMNNLSIEQWLLKIDDETQGRGIAYFYVEQIPMLKQIKKSQEVDVNGEFLQSLIQVLKEQLPKKLKIATNTLYNDYHSYMRDFFRKGGVIEAHPLSIPSEVNSPSIYFEIDPLGNTSVLGCYDRIQGSEYRNVACIYPQRSLPSMNLELLSKAIGNELYKKGIIGYVTVDLVSFADPNEQKGKPIFWAIGLDCYLNNYSAAVNYFYYLVKGKCDSVTGICKLTSEADRIQKNNQEKEQQDQDYQERISDTESLYQNSEKGLKNSLNESTHTIQSAKKMQSQQSSSVLSKYSRLSLKYKQEMNSNNKRNYEKLENQERSFVFIPQIQHQGLESLQYKTFFHLCRVESISYDLERKIGSTFVLVDTMQSGILGLMSIAKNEMMALKYINDAFRFMQKNLGAATDKFIKKEMFDSRTDKIFLSDVQSKMKLLYKQHDKNHKIKQLQNKKPNSLQKKPEDPNYL
ncbi:hypothetical protein PPERSA_08115 [Pseudocohnilembus persalinus]|uniref:IQCH-like ATP-grasp domain-containing protein n=1 Tax=Pseudocohnilembus persalinus TaxID=266149 RepID=A0A0V0QM30_PSEPJ|nr:hypothetical protein PPERSA_08115 [Pseudocohnilembus persalinus]|eukprot:KRX03040.1 hypothetical protein PPERSA_08115 [Pseudocohnilembus persalinus]